MCRAKFDKFTPRLEDKVDPHTPVPFGEMFGQGVDDLIGGVSSMQCYNQHALLLLSISPFPPVQTCIKQSHAELFDKQYHLLALPVLSLRPAYKRCSNHTCLCVPTKLLLSGSSPVAMTCKLFGGQLKNVVDFRLNLEPVLSLVVDPVCLLARSTILTLRPSQKEMKALLGGGAAEGLPKMEQQLEASPRMVLPHSSQL